MTVHLWKDGEYSTLERWVDPVNAGTFAVDDTCADDAVRYGKYVSSTTHVAYWMSISKKMLPPEFVLLLTTLGIEC